MCNMRFEFRQAIDRAVCMAINLSGKCSVPTKRPLHRGCNAFRWQHTGFATKWFDVTLLLSSVV